MLKRIKIATVFASVAAAALVAYASAGMSSPGAAAIATGAPAPEFAGIERWLNGPPTSLRQLRGKVVLVDFWTFDCINCVHTLPHVESLYEKYRDKGLVVIGVHTPEYAFERDTKNLTDAIKRYGITYPVAQDNQYATWNAYGNQYWPAVYLLDKKGNLVYSHFGEGSYAETEAQVRTLLGLS
ncbi:thioredoxin [Trinickia dabaoshanensis]|uniref:Thioredoxin n=1 Tax=Trinickia dabaoshanensis TaxID=564714 RepID=A0A2N7VIS4_9BURK|nr:thioredoxin family protein [Trinickia dabaoshanensis]PMS17017.1 thioredoxin [Trinickia dabaoshanensis]